MSKLEAMMVEYSKVQSVFDRDERTHKFILGQFSLPEFYYLKDNTWVWTEKINGTNVRVTWDGLDVTFQGRTSDSQLPPKLLERLQDVFPVGMFRKLYPTAPMTLYGEGYGAGIQKGGGNYNSKGCDFILFDVLITPWWLERENIDDIASKLGIRVVPIIGVGTIGEALDVVQQLSSTFGDFLAEGLVLKPQVAFWNRRGERVITKMKYRDF